MQLTQLFLTAEELSNRWGGTPSFDTLAVWRSRRYGPPFHKIGGSIKYSVEDIEDYEKSRRSGDGQ